MIKIWSNTIAHLFLIALPPKIKEQNFTALWFKLMLRPPKPSLIDFLAQPETKPAREYSEGHIIQKPLPQGEHSQLRQKLIAALNLGLENDKIALALPELRCTFGDRSIVPDIAVFTWPRIPITKQGTIANQFETAPDWLIEILSPNQSTTRVTSKILHAIQNGTQLGWLIDPSERLILVFYPNQSPIAVQMSEARIPAPNFATTVSLTTQQIFAWLTFS